MGDSVTGNAGRRTVLAALAGIGVGAAGTGAALGTEKEAPAAGLGSLDVRQFGARCDGRSDDSDALEAALAAAARVPLPPPIMIPGPCRLDRSVRVRRPVDATKAVLRIVGSGPGAGFVSGLQRPMFVGELARDGSPGTEFLRFEAIRFEAGIPSAGPVMSGDFLRIVFAFCEFIGIACLASDRYAQEWRFINCLARGWRGTFFRSAGGYGVTSTSSKYQFGGAAFRIVDPTLLKSGCVGCSFVQDIFEGSTGPFLEFELGKGVAVTGLYSEANEKPTIMVGGHALSTGISVSGCFFGTREDNRAAPGFAEIHWNKVNGAVSSGNTALGRLHHRDARAANLVSQGDHSDTGE